MKKKWKMGAIALAVTLPLGGVAAFAAEHESVSAESKAQSQFEQQYQKLWQQEQSLLQQAEASKVDTPQIDALKQTVELINAQVASLHNIEQALAQQVPSIPHPLPPNTKTEDEAVAHAKKEISTLQSRLKSDEQRIERDKNSHRQKDKSDLRQAMADYNKTKAQLTKAQAELSKWTKEKEEKEAEYGYWLEHPYNGGLTELRQSILSLEQAAIHYTNEWISLEQTSAGKSTVGSSTGGNSTGGNATIGNNTGGNTTDNSTGGSANSTVTGNAMHG
jgi:DNA repair exonuclease SbcCD ATPase subunit